MLWTHLLRWDGLCCSPDPLLVPCRSLCLSTRRELSTENSPGQGGRRLLLLCAHAGARAGEPALARGGRGRADRVQTDVLPGLRLARAEPIRRFTNTLCVPRLRPREQHFFFFFGRATQ